MRTSRSRPHTHPCSRCQVPVTCSGQLERNHDGWPEVICGLYHLPGGTVAKILCDSCEDALCPVCRSNERPKSEYGPRYRRCEDCEDGEGWADTSQPSARERYEQAWQQKARLR